METANLLTLAGAQSVLVSLGASLKIRLAALAAVATSTLAHVVSFLCYRSNIVAHGSDIDK